VAFPRPAGDPKRRSADYATAAGRLYIRVTSTLLRGKMAPRLIRLDQPVRSPLLLSASIQF